MAAAGTARSLRRLTQGCIIAGVGVALGLLIWLTGAFGGFEAKTWDWREQLFARPGRESDKIVFIFRDQESLDWGKNVNGLPWPWPREVFSVIADFCRRAGAKALIFDLLFSEASPIGVADDESLGRAISANGRVVNSFFLGKANAEARSWPPDLPQSQIQVFGLQEWIGSVKPRTLAFPFASFPIPEVAKAARMLANTNLSPDPDTVLRRAALFNTFDGRVVPSQGLAAYLAGNPGEHVVSIKPGLLTVDGLSVPIDSEGRAILRYRGPTKTHLALPAGAVIQSELQLQEGKEPNIDPSRLAGKYVFFGDTAPALLDVKPTPMGGVSPGVEVHATMLDNLLSNDFISAVPPWAMIALLVLLCAGAGISASSVSGAGRSVLIYGAFLPLAPALGLAAYALGYWLQILALETGVAIALVGSSLASYATEGRQKRYIKGAFKQYLSSDVIEELIAHPERLKLGGEKRELSIFFSDLQGFTSISEVLSPEDLTTLLNEYLSAMTDIIQEEGGTIDKYEGDAIIAFWNAPVSQDDHARRAIRAALRCQAKLEQMRPALHSRVGKFLYMRIGMHSGPAVVGNMGSHTRFNYTMLGDAVNLASRLEGTNKQFRSYTMASAATMGKAGGAFPAREIARVAVVGRKEPVTVYEPMFPEVFSARAREIEAFGRGLSLFYDGRFAEAREVFSSISDQDPPAAAYAEKCGELIASPSQGPWAGVWVMTSK